MKFRLRAGSESEHRTPRRLRCCLAGARKAEDAERESSLVSAPVARGRKRRPDLPRRRSVLTVGGVGAGRAKKHTLHCASTGNARQNWRFVDGEVHHRVITASHARHARHEARSYLQIPGGRGLTEHFATTTSKVRRGRAPGSRRAHRASPPSGRWRHLMAGAVAARGAGSLRLQ